MSGLEIKLFGVLVAERDGQPLAHLPSRKVRDLLAYLLLNRQAPRAREQMAELFWPGLDGDKARHCLNTALWRLRGALSPLEDNDHPYLRVDVKSIGFNTASTFTLDVAEFESRCALAANLGPDADAQQAVLYQQAVALYVGDLLTDCYDDWCLVERERLQCLYMRALGNLLRYHMRCREHDAAIACAQRILACDPLRERVHRALIRLYLDDNQPAAALRQYNLCAEMVRRELGADVMPETRALLARITAPSGPRLLPILASTPGKVEGTESPTSLAATLAAAQSRLDEATVMLDRLSAEVREASVLMEDIRRRVDNAAAGMVIPPTSVAGTKGRPALALATR